MVIGNDDIEPQHLSFGDRRVVSYSRINGNNQGHPVFFEERKALRVHAVSFRVPVRDVIADIIVTDHFEKIVEQGPSGDAIAIVVAPYRNALSLRNRPKHARNALLHIGKQKWIVGISLKIGVHEPRGFFLR